MFPTTESGPKPRPERNEQWPLGPHPSSDDLLDLAVECTFPASDPIAAGCAEKLAQQERERRASPREAGQPARERPSSR